MKSCIYKGLVRHQRLEPRIHDFTYSLFMMYVDLDELPDLFNPYKLWSVDAPGLASFLRKDHVGNQQEALSDSIRKLVFEQTGYKTNGPIRLLTHFRYFGYVFNPLCLYYCYDKDGLNVEYVVAEVSNTPWKEKHCYVLTNNLKEDNHFSAYHPKEFHVSPFMDLDMEYRWKVGIPNKSLNVQIENWKDNKKIFDAIIDLKRIEINQINLRNVLINYPLMTLKVTSAIHFEALKLWLKGIAFVSHPKHHRT